ncbi:MAG: carbon-nitrogen hydrolase family protein [Alphaproteobacteria bacterium]|nr:carbon-nitrogen hydrolase family protein [Alphaproteobacteria bacterium]
MARKLRVAAVQLRSTPDAAANRAEAAPFIREAASAGARFVATPENTGRLDRDRPRLLDNLAKADLVAEERSWGRLAEEHGVWLLVGSVAIPAGPGKVYNRSLFFSPAGKRVATYDKIHMFDVDLGAGETYRESSGVEAGRQAVVVEGPMGAKIGLTICYDLRFAELYRKLARAGAEILTIPAAFTVPTGQAHWETLIRARAIETGCFVIAPAQGGLHADGRSTWGHSVIVGPWGEIVGKLDHDEPGLLVADLDLDKVAETRAKVPAWTTDADFAGP